MAGKILIVGKSPSTEAQAALRVKLASGDYKPGATHTISVEGNDYTGELKEFGGDLEFAVQDWKPSKAKQASEATAPKNKAAAKKTGAKRK